MVGDRVALQVLSAGSTERGGFPVHDQSSKRLPSLSPTQRDRNRGEGGAEGRVPYSMEHTVGSSGAIGIVWDVCVAWRTDRAVEGCTNPMVH